MKKILFASVLVLIMTMLGVIAFAAEDVPAADADMIIEHEAQGDVMPISETVEEVPAADAIEEKTEDVVIDYAAISKTTIIIDGKTVTIDEAMGMITEKDGVIFVPVRVALEALGYQVSWAEKEQMVMGANQQNGAMFIMQVENTLLFYLTADGEEGKLSMEAAPFANTEEGRTYVPLKALASALGYKAGVDGSVSDVAVVALSK